MAQILEFPLSARERERIVRAGRRRERRAHWDAMRARIMGEDPIRLPTPQQLVDELRSPYDSK